MKTFREFLQEKAREDDQRERLGRREEWVTSVSRLIRQVRQWLEEADTEKLLIVSEPLYDKREQGLGTYRVPGLDIGLGDSLVKIIPVGRNATGVVGPKDGPGVLAQGRVDISDGMRKYLLLRTLEEGRDQWHALDERFEATLLDRARFEEIMHDLLS